MTSKRILAIMFVSALVGAITGTFLMRVAHSAPELKGTCPHVSASLQVYGYDGLQPLNMCVTSLQIWSPPAHIRVVGFDVVGATHTLPLRVSQLGYTHAV